MIAPLCVAAVVGSLSFGAGVGAAHGGRAATAPAAVAWVNGVPITRTTFDHWLFVAANAERQPPGGRATMRVVPVPPRFAGCIALLRRQLRALLKGKRSPTTAQLRAECAVEYQSDLQEVMQFLISSEWVILEAGDEGVSVSDRTVAHAFAAIAKRQFPTRAAYDSFLASSGETLADLLLRVKLELLSDDLSKKAQGSPTVTAAQIAGFYAANKRMFSRPESLNASIILTRTRSQARVALDAIMRGTPFPTEARKVSVDVTTKDRGGALRGVVRGQEERVLSRALFSARLDRLEGPIKTPFGYYIFKVTKVNRATQESLAQVSPAIERRLIDQAKAKALSAWVMAFTQRWTARTTCLTGYVVQDCQGYQAPTPTTAPTPVQG